MRSAVDNQASKRIVILLGLPGSGKGTLASLCTRELGWPQLSTGDLCRRHIAQGTEVGKSIDFAIKSGKLVSDSIISNMVFDWLIASFAGVDTVVFDGFPRTAEQAQLLNDFLTSKFPICKLELVKLEVPDQVVRNRIANRLICGNRDCQAGYSQVAGSSFCSKVANQCDRCGGVLKKRSDDNDLALDTRLKTYAEHEQRLLDILKVDDNEIVVLNGNRSIEEVFAEMKDALGV